MAIDYEEITQAIVDLLQTAIPESNVKPEPAEVGLVNKSEIGVTRLGKQRIEDHIGNPTPYQTVLRYSILCSEYHPDGSLEAIKKRDVLESKVEEAFTSDPDRNLTGLINWHQLGNTDYETAQDETAGFWAAANIELLVSLMS